MHASKDGGVEGGDGEADSTVGKILISVDRLITVSTVTHLYKCSCMSTR